MEVALLGGDEIASCEEHLRSCGRHDPLPKQPLLGDVMRLLRITLVGAPSEAPPRLH
jgi:hypothetical protein